METKGGVQRVARPVDALLRSGRVSDAEVASADRFYNDYAFATGARDPEKSGGGGGVDGYNISQLDAITNTSAVRRAMGPGNMLLLVAFVIDERSISSLAGGSASVRERLTKTVTVILKRLTEHYAQRDGAAPGTGSKIRAVIVD